MSSPTGGSSTGARLVQYAVLVGGTLVALVAGYLGFVVVPRNTGVDALNVLLVVVVGFLGMVASRNIASSLVSSYNVAEVEVKGPIMRDSRGMFPTSPVSSSSDDIVEQIERADADPSSEALLVSLNTPGGEVVPSDDIRRAVSEFDGPTVAYATDTCASGGYWIASACDDIFARETSLVGSIGVIGSRVNAKELADRIGLSYERLAAGDYKDAGTPLKEMSDDERDYLQGLIDGYYDTFVERVTEERDISSDEVRDTEARVYLGKEAVDIGLVDSVGTRDDVEGYLSDAIGADAKVREFVPRRSLRNQFRKGAEGVAYAFGSGVASVVSDDFDGFDFRVEK